jgi:hypothetical protein
MFMAIYSLVIILWGYLNWYSPTYREHATSM